jgi:hypothetical protein
VQLVGEGAVQAVQRGLRSSLYTRRRYSPCHEVCVHHVHRRRAGVNRPQAPQLELRHGNKLSGAILPVTGGIVGTGVFFLGDDDAQPHAWLIRLVRVVVWLFVLASALSVGLAGLRHTAIHRRTLSARGLRPPARVAPSRACRLASARRAGDEDRERRFAGRAWTGGTAATGAQVACASTARPKAAIVPVQSVPRALKAPTGLQRRSRD